MADPASEDGDAREKGALEKALGVFADIRGGEAVTALMMVVSGFLLLLSYYLVKVVREPLIVGAGESGAEWKSYAAAGQAVLLVLVLRLYDWLYERSSRMKLLTWTYIFFTLCLIAFFLLANLWNLSGWSAAVSATAPLGDAAIDPPMQSVVMGVGFFLWVGIFSVFVIAQFWSFANDVYTSEQGKRLFGFIAIGGTVGAAAGSSVAKAMIEALGSEFPVMPVGALVLVMTLGLLWLVNKREAAAMARREAAEEEAKGDEQDKKQDNGGGFKLVLSQRYLLYIALLILVLNWVNTTGEYILDRYLKETAASEGVAENVFIGSFRGGFFTYVNIVVVALQTLVVSRFIQHLGVRIAIFVLPVVAILGYASLALIPVLTVLKVVKIAENSVDYSLQNTTQQALWLKTTRAAKYKAKAVIDTFFKRAGDVLAAVVVFVGSAAVLDLPLSVFIYLNIALVVVWLLIARGLAREHKRREVVDSNAT